MKWITPLVAMGLCAAVAAACQSSDGGGSGADNTGSTGGSEDATGATGNSGNSGGSHDGTGSVGSTGAAGGVAGTGGRSIPTPSDGDRPDFMEVAPPHFAFGYSYYWDTHAWPPEVRERGVAWDYMYWYQTTAADETVLPARLQEAKTQGVMPVLTHYQLLSRGENAGYTGEREWDIVIQAVQDDDLMLAYYDDVQQLMEGMGTFDGYAIFQTEPDTTTFLRQYHTAGTFDATQGAVSVAASGHPDLADLPNTIAGYVQAIVRLRDLYAPDNVYIGLCIFDNENGFNPQDTVTFMESLGTSPDVLFTHHIVKYSNRNEGWWDDYDDIAQERFLTWIKTVTDATGLRYIHWQTTLGPADYGLMPDYPTVERITDLVEAGSIGNLLDIYKLEGPPHSQPWHGFSSSPPADHPAYNSLDKLEERLLKYYADPIAVPR